MNELAKRIRQAINQKGITFQQLAEKTGYPKSALQRYASGTTDKVPIDRVVAIAKACDVSARWLMDWQEKEQHDTKKEEPTLVVTEQQRLLLIAYRHLDENQKELIRRMLGIGGVSLQADSESFSEQDNAC